MGGNSDRGILSKIKSQFKKTLINCLIYFKLFVYFMNTLKTHTCRYKIYHYLVS